MLIQTSPPKPMLTQTRRALQGWLKVEPQRTRPPIPRTVISGSCVELTQKSKLDAVLGILVMFTAYLRLGEAMDLQKSHAGFTTFAMVGKSIPTKGPSPNVSDQPHLRTDPKGLEIGPEEVGVGRKLWSVVPAPPLRSQSRSMDEASSLGWGKAARKMGGKSLDEEIRIPCSNIPGVSSASPKSSSPLFEIGATVSDGGPKIFQPKEPVTGQTKGFVLELFSGCARLSRAMASQGFTAVAYDISYGSGCDLLDANVFRRLCKFLKRHSSKIKLVWLGYALVGQGLVSMMVVLLLFVMITVLFWGSLTLPIMINNVLLRETNFLSVPTKLFNYVTNWGYDGCWRIRSLHASGWQHRYKLSKMLELNFSGQQV